MLYEEFLSEVTESGCYTVTENEFVNKTKSYYEQRRDKNKYDKKTPYMILAEECIGGNTGGNCWGGEPHGYTRPEGAQECQENFESYLDRFIERLVPNITYLQYKRILKLRQTGEYSIHEYYGNSSDYMMLYISLQDLYNELAAMELI